MWKRFNAFALVISRTHAFFVGFMVGFCAVCLVLSLLLVGV
jgi:hypothetical protein